MRALVILSENCGTNPGWADWSWYTETPDPGLLSVSFLIDPYLLIFFIRCLLLAVPSMNDSQRGTEYFKSRNIVGRTPSFASLNIYLGWRWYNLSCQYFNSCCKGDINSRDIMLSIFLVWDSFIYLYSLLNKLELIKYLAHSLNWVTP